MNRFEKYKYHGLKTTSVKIKDTDTPTRQGLAYTPADMERMTDHGIPVQSGELAQKYYDGDTKSDFDITSDRIKGNDLNDLWEEHQDIVAKARKAYAASKKPKTE